MKNKPVYLTLVLILGISIISGCTVTFTVPTDISTLPKTQQPIIFPTEPIPYNPIVVISPTSGPVGTQVQVVASGFTPNTSVSVAMGPVNSGFSEIAQGTTDSNGTFVVQVPIQGRPGMELVFAVADEGQPGVLSASHFNILDTSKPVVDIAPTSGEAGTTVQVIASGFPSNSPILVAMGPVNSELGQVAQGITDENGVFITHIIAQGSLGMRLVFAIAVEGQPGVLSINQFQITGAVPNPQPVIPTPTPYLDMWTTYSNIAFAVSLEYPAEWQPISGYGSPETGEIRFGGVNGFFHIGAMDTDSIDMAVAAEAEHILHPYGVHPTVEALQIQGQEARLILPSEDQPNGMQYQASIIIRYPQPVNVLGTPCRFFILWADQPHVRAIAQTIQFIQ